MFGLAWQIWAMIGFTIFWVSLAVVIVRLYLHIRRLESEEAKTKRKRDEMEIEVLRRTLRGDDNL